MRKISSIFCTLTVLACFVSCQQENAFFNKGGEIKVKLEGSAVTKSESSSFEEEFLFAVPMVTSSGDTLSVEAFISDMPDDYAQYCPTKGAPITTANIGDKFGSFKTTVYKGTSIYADERSGQMSNVTVSYAEGEWSLAGGPYYWPKDGSDIVFCSNAPVSGSGVSGINWNNGTKVAFSYVNTPSGVDGSGKYHDAENQQDILFAINKQNINSNDGVALINFSHALVGVKFIKGDIEGCTVESISLKNFKSSGNSEGTPRTDNPNSLSFTWSDQATLKDYTQTFGTAVDIVADKGSLDPNEDESCTFMMIPQELDDEAGVEIKLKYGTSDSQTLIVNLGSMTAEEAGSENNAGKIKDWSTYAGKVITLRVNRAGISVAVDETFADGVKANVGAKNTGGKIEYVRAAIVANWVDEDGNICETCDFVNDTENLTGYLASGCNWTYNSADGFYYYSKAIVPGAVTTGKIFTSYKTPTAPEEGLSLEMAVIVQAVEYGSDCAKAKAAWKIGDGFLTSEIEY